MRPAYTQHMYMHPAHFGSLGGIICVTHQVHVYVCDTFKMYPDPHQLHCDVMAKYFTLV